MCVWKNVSKASIEVGVCHCQTCRKLASEPMFLVDYGTEVKIEGQENLAIYNLKK